MTTARLRSRADGRGSQHSARLSLPTQFLALLGATAGLRVLHRGPEHEALCARRSDATAFGTSTLRAGISGSNSAFQPSRRSGRPLIGQ
jgi:hypothetical protein